MGSVEIQSKHKWLWLPSMAVICLVASSGSPCRAESQGASADRTAMIVECRSITTDQPVPCGLGSVMVVTLDPNTRTRLSDGAQSKNTAIGLFLNGEFLDDVMYDPDPGDPNRIRFRLRRTDSNRVVWGHVLGEWLTGKHQVHVNVGLEDKSDVPPNKRTVAFEPLKGAKMQFLLLMGLATTIITIILGHTTDMLRDKGSPRSDKRRPSYSLGRTQMAFWFLNVLIAFLIIWGITGAADTITPSMLVLIGISAGTALGAISIDESKRTETSQRKVDLETELQPLVIQAMALDKQMAAVASDSDTLQTLRDSRALVQKQMDMLDAESGNLFPQEPPASQSVLLDLLTDAKGVSLHRLQIVVWTVVLACIFWGDVYHQLIMPDFDGTLLGLMGISSGTYLGFKFPEKPA